MLHALSHRIFTPRGRYHYHFHFPDKKIKVQRDLQQAQGHTGEEQQSRDLNQVWGSRSCTCNQQSTLSHQLAVPSALLELCRVFYLPLLHHIYKLLNTDEVRKRKPSLKKCSEISGVSFLPSCSRSPSKHPISSSNFNKEQFSSSLQYLIS